MKNLTQRFPNSDNVWERFQKLHLLLVQSGAVVDKIHLHPTSIDELTDCLAPRPRRGEVYNPSPITGAVTLAGPVDIVSDPNGIVV